MDSYDRDELVDKLEEMIGELCSIEEDFSEELEDCSEEFKDARIALLMIVNTVKDIKCSDDEDEDVYNEEEL
jgi:hypothetical protein